MLWHYLLCLSTSTRQGTSAAVIQDFEISISAVGDDQYLVRTESVTKGVQLAEERVRWPIDHWLSQTQAFMHDPLLELLSQQRQTHNTSRVSNTTQASTLVGLGQTLHKALFQGQLRDSWVTAQGIAQNRQALLRLRLGMKDSRLQQLPWEVLHEDTQPLATGTDIIFSRYILGGRQGNELRADRRAVNKALKILVVIASPDDQERLELKQEVEHLRAELHPTETSSGDHASLDIQLTLLEQPGRAELTQELDRGDYQVLHYAGHSDLGNAGGDLYLVSRQTGLTERLSGEDLAGLLVNNGVQLAVFNSCRGGYSPSSVQGWQERNLAQALINRGMPSVIAMAERIPDDVAIAFTQLLYRNLKKGFAIDSSLNRTRQGLRSSYGSHQFYWALPTLYMQPAFDGYLLGNDGDHKQAEQLNEKTASLTTSAPTSARVARTAVPSRTAKVQDQDSRTTQGGHGLLSLPAKEDTASTDVDSIKVRRTPPPVGTNQAKLVSNNDARSPFDMVQRPGHPSSTMDIDADVDGELRVPDEIKTPRGFYGEPIASKPTSRSTDAMASAEKMSRTQRISSVRSARAISTGTKPQDTGTKLQDINANSANVPSSAESSVDRAADISSSDEIYSKEAPAEMPKPYIEASMSGGSGDSSATENSSADEELVGERLTRSHTLHTKILTVPGIASIGALLLLCVASFGFFQRIRQAPSVRSPVQSELSQSTEGLAGQIEVALLQGNIDSAIAPAKALIEQGQYVSVITALETATNRQQQDVVLSFFRGRAQWGLVKQGDPDFSAGDALRSWQAALESEPDWMEISMALGFSQQGIGQDQDALESWERAIELAERQSNAQVIYFSDQSVDEYILNAHAGVAMAALALSKVEANPNERNRLIDQALTAYQKVMNEASAEFGPNSLGNNWLWLSPAIKEWVDAKRELSQMME